MRLLRLLAFWLTVLLSAVAWCQTPSEPTATGVDQATDKLLSATGSLIQARRFAEAIQQYDKVIAQYEQTYHDGKTRYFSARTPAESLMYMAEAATTGTSAVSVSGNWSGALFLKSYVLTEMGRTQEAKAVLQRALELAPRNSHFLSELANLYQRDKDWPQAIKTFGLAEAAANEFSPPDRKNVELARAWRGLAFVAVEQGRLADAENLYLKCLALDQNDTAAARELQYVRGLKGKPASANAATAPNQAQAGTAKQAADPIRLNDAVQATYFATLRCDVANESSPDMTNVLMAHLAAAQEVERRFPAMKPPEVAQALRVREDKIKAAVEDQISKRGCEATEIRQLVQNFHAFSKRSTGASAPQ